MKAITLYQPWASLIAEGYKTIETRQHDRFKDLKGRRIAIHAGMRFDRWPYVERDQHPNMHKIKMPHGVIVCTAQVDNARWLRGDSIQEYDAAMCITDGLFGLFLSDIQKVEPPIPARGWQGIWEIENRLVVSRNGEA